MKKFLIIAGSVITLGLVIYEIYILNVITDILQVIAGG